MENHHFIVGKIHYKWQFSIAMLNYQRVAGLLIGGGEVFLLEWQRIPNPFFRNAARFVSCTLPKFFVGHKFGDSPIARDGENDMKQTMRWEWGSNFWPSLLCGLLEANLWSGYVWIVFNHRLFFSQKAWSGLLLNQDLEKAGDPFSHQKVASTASGISGLTQVEETRFPLFWKGYISTYPEILFGRVFVAELFLGSTTLFDGLATNNLFNHLVCFSNHKFHQF